VFDRSCASRHVGGAGTDKNGWALHPPADTGVDGAYAARTQTRPTAQRLCMRCGSTCRTCTMAARPRSPTSWRTTTGFAAFGLTADQQRELVEYLKSHLSVGIGARERANRRLFREASVPT
jgi:hypothetical protein